MPSQGILVLDLPPGIETLVLASDGYPKVKETLEESEAALQEVLRDDPLLFRIYKSTKGMQKGTVSFDDRAYVKVMLKNEA